MIDETTLTLIAIFILLLLSAFFSHSETALTAASRARMHQLERTGERRAKVVSTLLAARERLIGALLLGNNAVNIMASALATSVMLDLFGDAGVAYATFVMTVLVLIFAEVMPKTLAITDPDRSALRVAPSVRLIVAFLGPLVIAVEAVVRGMLAVFGKRIDENTAVLSAHEELRGAVDFLHKEGAVLKSDRDMVGGILDLPTLTVADVMIHRTAMQALDADETPAALVRQVLESPFTRLPLWREKPDNIVGIVHAKDLLRALQAHQGVADAVDVTAIASDPWFVPETTRLDDQLKAFLRRKVHIAMVVDEYGEVQGLVTLEDILEEIVGDIADEQDIVVQGVRPEPDGSVNVAGSVPIRDLNRVMDWQLPDEEAITVAGLVIHEARLIPEVGQAFTFHGFRFQVLRRQRNRITMLKITRLAKLEKQG